MKKKFILGSAFFLCALGTTFAQGEMDAYRLSQSDITGTARSAAMGGAFGALGGDVAGISINPAGIGVYKSSEVVTTLNFQNTKAESELNVGKISNNKFKFSFNNLAYVGTFPIESDVAPLLNFGFSFNRLKNFDRTYRSSGKGLNWSMADYMALRANWGGINNTNAVNDIMIQGSDNYPFRNYDWLGVFGYNSHLLAFNPTASETQVNDLLGSAKSSNDLYVREKGYVDSYDFNIGTTFSDIISVGLTVAVTDIDYRKESVYNEDFSGQANSGYTLGSRLKTEGTGWQVKAGVIIKPINELRIGIAYHSPTWYNMTDYYDADMDYNLTGILNDPSMKNYFYSGAFADDYKMRTPDKFIFSLAGVIGQTAIISADYEYANYKSNMKLTDPYINYSQSELMKEGVRGASTLRVGAEVRFTPQFSGRVGYAWMQSPLTKALKNGEEAPIVTNADASYVLDGDKHNFTYGLGYRFTKNLYTDVAFIMSSQKSDLQAYYTLNNEQGASLKTNTFQGLLTLGVRF